LSGEGDNPDDPNYQWQQEQLARDAEQQRQKDKNEKARARRARSAQRKLKKAKQDLEKLGEITDWEEEFVDSVDERIEKYGAAFQDREKGAASEALSNLQKQVLAQMRRKAKDKGKQSPERKPRSGFKNKSGFKPRVRNIEDDLIEDEPPIPEKRTPTLKVIKGGKEG
jgi:phosphoglycerate-specific signal transduction histidine kinase